MSYAVEVGPQASEDLSKLPAEVRRGVIRSLRVLTSEPARRSRPCSPPYPPGMLYRAEFQAQGVTCLLDAVFVYGQDEQTLHIERIFVEYA